MERLTERHQRQVFCNADCSEMIDYAEDCECPHLQKMRDKLAHYEDLEEQGLLLKLPCKVGDTIYLLDYEERKMDEATVDEIMVDSEGLFINTDYANYLHTKLEYVFLTKAEAEKALEEMEKNNG